MAVMSLCWWLCCMCRGISRFADPGYLEGDPEDDEAPDPLTAALPTKEAYQHIRALPAAPGAAIIFTHRWALPLALVACAAADAATLNNVDDTVAFRCGALCWFCSANVCASCFHFPSLNLYVAESADLSSTLQGLLI